jgi:hypothetical protein
MRNLEIGQKTAASFGALVRATNDLEDSLVEQSSFWTNLKNASGSFLAGAGKALADMTRPIFGWMNENWFNRPEAWQAAGNLWFKGGRPPPRSVG